MIYIVTQPHVSTTDRRGNKTNLKEIILFLFLLLFFKAESQNANPKGKYEYLYMDSIINTVKFGKDGLLGIYNFDTTKFYYFSLMIVNPLSQKRDIKIYNNLIKSANRYNSKKFYFLFEKMDEYHPNSSDISETRRNQLEIHQQDLTDYLKTLEILNPKFKNDFSKNKVQTVTYKYHDRMWHTKHSL